MFKPIVLLGLGVAGVAVLASLSWSQDQAAPGQTARTFAFDRADALKDWTITGDVTIDTARGRQGSRGSLRVGPGGKALLKLRDERRLGQGRVLGPRRRHPAREPQSLSRWARGGAWSRTTAGCWPSASSTPATWAATRATRPPPATAQDWFDQLFWLGVNRAPGRLAQVDVRLRCGGGPADPPQRPGADARSIPARPACRASAPSPSGATAARGTGRPSGWTTSRSRWAGR